MIAARLPDGVHRIVRTVVASGIAANALAFGLAENARAADPSIEQCLAASEQGQRLRDDGKYVRARALFASCAAQSCPAPVQRDCVAALTEVDRATPTVILVARTAREEDVMAARAMLDGVPVRLAGTPLAVDAGPHRLRVEAPGLAPAELAFVAVADEKNRVVRVTLGSAAPLPPAPAPAGTSQEHTSSTPVLALALAGVAVASGATSLILGLTARSRLDEIEHAPCASTHTCDAAELRSVKTRLVVADVALGLTAVAGAGALWLFIVDARRPGVAAGVSASGAIVRGQF